MDERASMEEGAAEASSRRPVRRTGSGTSRVPALTVVLIAALLCTKLGGQSRSAPAPSRSVQELAVRELLTAATAPGHAQAVKTAKSAALHAAAHTSVADKQGSFIKKVQKLDEEAPPAEEAPAEEAPPAEPPAASEVAAPEDGGADTDAGGLPEGAQDDLEPGWDKSGWRSGDVASWVITGPLITVCFSFFMFYTYGVPAGALTLIICAVIDVATFYYNW